jgi:hypothetical protein
MAIVKEDSHSERGGGGQGGGSGGGGQGGGSGGSGGGCSDEIEAAIASLGGGQSLEEEVVRAEVK